MLFRSQRLHLNDVRRVIRALEVYRLTGRPFSQQPQIKTDSRFSYRVVSLAMPRDILYARIEQRIDQMLADGLAEEVSRLLKSGVPRDAKAMKAIGYKEMIPYALGETTLDEAVYALKLNTSPYVNIIAAREQDKDNPTYQKFVKIFQSDNVRKYINDNFSDGLVPAF